MLLVLKPILKLALFFPQKALAIGVLTSSLGVGDRDISRVVRGGVIGGVAKGGTGGVLSQIWVGGVVLGGGLACFWWGVN